MIRIEQRRIAVNVVQDGVAVRVNPSVSRPIVAPAILQVRVSSAGRPGLDGLSQSEIEALIAAETDADGPSPALIFENHLI